MSAIAVVESGLRRKVLWLMGLRAATVTVLLGTAILVQARASDPRSGDPFFLLIGVTYSLTALYALTLKLVERHRWLVGIQLSTDAVVISTLVSLTGGVTSYFSSLYVVPILAASIIQSARAGYFVAALSATLYEATVVAQYAGAPALLSDTWLVHSSVMLPPLRVAQYIVGLNIFGFGIVAVLSGYLVEGLRRADARLERASHEIADLHRLNQHVIDSLTSGLVTVDSQGHVLTFNRTAETITGHSFASVVGRKVGQVLQLPAEVEATLTPSLQFNRGRRVEFDYITPAGKRIEIGLSAAPLITGQGRDGFIVSFQDVTELKKLEREARMKQRLAAVGEMAAGIAHEIRNPLASMSGSIQILRQELPLSEDQAQLMTIVLRESERLNAIIQNFLAYARPQRFQLARLDLRRVITDTALLLRNSAECGVAHHIEVDVPDAPTWYEADEGQIRQIVWNLATNGLHAMPDGGRLRLSSSVAPGGAESADADASGDVTFSVQDEGVGIPADDLDGIFQPFKGSFARGTGLGLAIVHRIVSDYNGEIHVTSQVGAGTTVSIHLPARVEVAAT